MPDDGGGREREGGILDILSTFAFTRKGEELETHTQNGLYKRSSFIAGKERKGKKTPYNSLAPSERTSTGEKKSMG